MNGRVYWKNWQPCSVTVSKADCRQDASAVDQIRQKYDEALNSVDKYNKKIDEFNKKNGTKVKGIGLTDIDALKSAEQTEILNTIYKQDAQHYLDAVALKKQAFDDFEQIQKQGNATATQQAKSAYHDQIGEFNSFLDYLKDQANKLKVSIALQPDNIGTQQALLEVNKQITEETQKQKAEALKQRAADYATALQDAMTFVDRKKQIDDKYYKEVQAISSNADDKEMAAHLAALRQAHEQETTDLQNNLLRQSALYQQLNEDIISFTRDQLKKRIDLLKKELKDGFVIDLKTGIKTDIELTPQMRADVQSQVDSSENLVANTDKTVVNLNKIATEANGVGSAFNDLASAVSGINQSLADSLQLIGNIVNGVGKAASSLSAFKAAQAKGNTAEGIAGQITAGIGIASVLLLAW
jgi:hypothetical protein